MEALRLFDAASEHVAPSAVGDRAMGTPEPNEAAWHEAERFLADQLEREGDLARIQAALALCHSAGGRGWMRAEEAVADRYRFPRSAHAIERVCELLKLPVADRPAGFWPRFLLEQLDEIAVS